jgi:hypothetical protein
VTPLSGGKFGYFDRTNLNYYYTYIIMTTIINTTIILYIISSSRSSKIIADKEFENGAAQALLDTFVTGYEQPYSNRYTITTIHLRQSTILYRHVASAIRILFGSYRTRPRTCVIRSEEISIMDALTDGQHKTSQRARIISLVSKS